MTRSPQKIIKTLTCSCWDMYDSVKKEKIN